MLYYYYLLAEAKTGSFELRLSHRVCLVSSRAVDDVDTENMNPEEIYNSFKKTSADIQSLSKLGSQFDDVRKDRER